MSHKREKFAGWKPLVMVDDFEMDALPDSHRHLMTRFGEIWMNNRYQVIKSEAGSVVMPDTEEERSIVHLSIKRIDKKPIHLWRDLLRIKNELVGDECDAIELYPRMSRLVDSSNQYHLFVFPEGYHFPIGFNDRFVKDGDGTTDADKPRQQPIPTWYGEETNDAGSSPDS